jgi:hypothetical protein
MRRIYDNTAPIIGKLTLSVGAWVLDPQLE